MPSVYSPSAISITQLLRGRWCGHYGLCRCPIHEDRNPSMTVRDTGDGGTHVHCFAGCDWRDIKTKLDILRFNSRNEANRNVLRGSVLLADQVNPVKKRRWSAHAEGIWKSCRSLAGVAEEYLMGRGCTLPPSDGDLRFHPNLPNKRCNWTGPALVARVTDAVTGEEMSLHRTWITETAKAPIETPRMPLARHDLANGVVRLWPDEAVTIGLGVAEGIETALTAARAIQPVWSVIDAGHLTKFPVLDGVESLTIFVDNDKSQTGQNAARSCAERWADSGCEVRLVLPPTPGTDFNDWASN